MTNPAPAPFVIPLWPEDQLERAGWTQPEEATCLPDGLPIIRNVSVPTLTAYLPAPETATGTAVIVAHGGAFHFLAWEHEGTQVADWLTARGIAVFLLKYRLVQTGTDFPQCVWLNLEEPDRRMATVGPLIPKITADGLQAVRLVRQNASAWGVDPGKVGIMGFSAGGMVTFNVALYYDPASRPDFAAPIYSAMPPEAPIPADAPPLFLLCAADDQMASEVCTQFYDDWRSAGHSVELHIYARGGHGFGMKTLGLPSDAWITRFHEWLQSLELA